ncbi:glycosyltransferase family 2 protein [Cupriavidus alkaliphilus]|uniref:glycosyltransferase family 2 protein n=1 Tax=Cupriavidus alkaliphilus TaxID=942866 RepID=UPI000DC5201E|nr:glycosyltransferase involved in cell wall biosynthesis [Cupriavidus alkaliphilus]
MTGRPHHPRVSIVAPFYNESAAIQHFFAKVKAVLADLGCADYEIVCVNDGSRDDTLAQLVAASRHDPHIVVVDLSRNFGKEAALTAGIDEADGDVVIPIDADLQDPPELIGVMLEQWRAGYDVVLAKRSDRSSDGYLKRRTAELFYRVHNRLSDTPIPENVGDFRLMDRMVVEALKLLPERRRFMKGLFAWVGFRSTIIEYVREARVAGSTKFSGWKLINFAIEGITSFSTAPLRLTTYAGIVVSILSFIYAAVVVIRTLVHGIDWPGYSSMITVVLFLGGVQLISVGIVGEYVGRIYMESKGRPVYLVQRRYGKNRDVAEGR